MKAKIVIEGFHIKLLGNSDLEKYHKNLCFEMLKMKFAKVREFHNVTKFLRAKFV